MWSEQKDAIKKRMADSDAENTVSHYHLVACMCSFIIVSGQTLEEIFLFFFSSCSDFWPNSPTRRKRCLSSLNVWTLKRFELLHWCTQLVF